MFNLYIISLKNDSKRYRDVVNELKEANVPIQHIKWFEGYNGSNHRNNSRVVALCKILCADNMIGCALSHIELASHFLSSINDKYCVVLEDDVVIEQKSTFIQDIQNAYLQHSDKDVIKLFCQGICNDNLPKRNGMLPFYMEGSTAAYILTREGARKISSMRVMNHIDIQFNRLNTANVHLVSTRDREKHTQLYDTIPIFNQPIGFWMNQNILRKINLLQYLTIPVLYALYILYINPSIVHVNILLSLLAFMNIMPFYTINVFQNNTNVSYTWCMFALTAALCAICYISIQRLNPFTLYGILSLFMFHIVLMFNIIHILAK